MSHTEADIKSIFSLDPHQLAQALHPRLRQMSAYPHAAKELSLPSLRATSAAENYTTASDKPHPYAEAGYVSRLNSKQILDAKNRLEAV